MPHATQMSTSDTALLVIDVQEKLLPAIPDATNLVRNLGFLIEGARLLDLPLLATEQYPRGLGPTIPELAQRLPPTRPEKTGFSCCSVPSVVDFLHEQVRVKVVVGGMETHVCVLQTVLDLLALDFRVYIPVDAVSARFRLDHEVALRRMEQAGAILTTAETCLFEWVKDASHPQFKTVSRMVQERMQALRV